jgi:hypothetical protein
MYAIAVNEMISEAHSNTKIYWALFNHLNNFLPSFWVWDKRRECFAGQDYPPAVDQKVLKDKTIILYWFKSPDALFVE